MKKTEKELMNKNILKHGKNLNKIFNTGIEPVTLCKKLFRLENKAHRLATDYCNGVIDCEQWEELTQPILNKVVKILGVKNDYNFFVNGDCRGYALKMFPDFVKDKKIYTDWGDNGIIAPDFKTA